MDNTETALVRSRRVIPASHSIAIETVSTSAQLEQVNTVIQSAVGTWPLAERLKRLALGSLQYDALDLDEFAMLLGLDNGCPVAVAVAAVDHIDLGSGRAPCVLLHGLYVHSGYQARGIGRLMHQTVAARARKRGCMGILVKAQRVSRKYFVKQGFHEIVDPGIDYPYLYWKPITHVASNE